jgi:hypothetical protein
MESTSSNGPWCRPSRQTRASGPWCARVTQRRDLFGGRLLPHPHHRDLHRCRLRLVHRPRSRVSVLFGPDADRPGLRRQHRERHRASQPENGRPHLRLKPQRCTADRRRDLRHRTLHPDGDRRLHKLDQRPQPAGHRWRWPPVRLQELVRSGAANPQRHRPGDRDDIPGHLQGMQPTLLISAARR